MTVLFCDLVGSSRLSQELDPEDWLHLLHQLHSSCGEVIASHHGHVAQFLGDGLLAYFGYPVAAEDSPRRAVAAGLALVRVAARIPIDAQRNLKVRVGIHTGSVVVGNIGSRGHQESLALGQVPNLAARIQEVAPESGVLVSPETFRLVEAFFEVNELAPVSLKGFDGTIRLREVVKSRGRATRLEAAWAAGFTPMVGRAEQIHSLREAWESAVAGHPGVALLVGEAGIGKSRLLHALKDSVRAAEGTSLELHCSEHAVSTALYPVTELLRTRLAIEPADDAATLLRKLGALLQPSGASAEQVGLVASLLGVPLPSSPSLPPARVRAGILEVLATWLATALPTERRLLVVEDLHWADPSTLELVKAILARKPQGSLLLVVTARPEFSADWLVADQLLTLSLGRLAGDDTRQLISHVVGDKTLPDEIVERLVQRAEGIPLFLEEMTRAVVESGVLRETPAGYELEGSVRDSTIPATLHDSLMGRLDQLGQGKPIAQLAAVLGREFSYQLFSCVWANVRSLPTVPLMEGLERLVGAQVITKQGDGDTATYQFKHSLLQESAYQSLLRGTRREYHHAAAKALLSEFASRVELEPELVARHFSEADMSDEAAEHWNRAGQRALAASAYAEAIAHFNSGLAELPRLHADAERSRREIDLRARLGVALITTRGFSSAEVEETFSRAAVLCTELGDEIPLRVLYGTWVVNLVRGDLASTSQMVANLERLAASPRDATSTLAINAMLGAWAFFRGEYGDAIRFCSVAAVHCDRGRPKAQHEALVQEHGFEGLLYPALYKAWASTLVGDLPAADEALADAVAMAGQIQDPYVSVGLNSFRAAFRHELGDIMGGGELAEQSRVIAQENGFVLWLGILTVVSGDRLLAEGKAADAVGVMEQGLTLLRAVGEKLVYVYYLTYLAEPLIACGQATRAKEFMEEGLAMTRSDVTRFCEPEFLRLLAEAELALGERDQAEARLRTALEAARAQGARLFELKSAMTLARLLHGRGHAAAARELLARARAGFGRDREFPFLLKADALLSEL
jgi:class 3 adenylate cyclase